MTDEEFLLAAGDEDSLKKQRARGAGRKRGRLDADTMPDEDFLAAMGLAESPASNVPHGTDAARQNLGPLAPGAPAYSLTDYAGENTAGPYSQEQQGRARHAADAFQAGRGAARAGGGVPEEYAGQGDLQEFTRGRHEQGDRDTAKGFADFSLGMLIGGPMSSGARRVLGATAETPVREAVAEGLAGGASGAIQATASGAAPRDILTATMLGAGTGAALNRLARPAHAPRTQAEMDAAALQAAGPRRRDLPEGQHGANQLAEEANARLDAAVAAREAARDAAIHEAEADASRTLRGQTADTRPMIHEIENIRGQNWGARGPTIPEADRRLLAAEAQLSRAPLPTEGPIPTSPNTELTFPELNNLRKGLNYRVEKLPEDLGAAGDRQAAGVVAGGVRRMDPRLGPGNFPGALDRYGAEQDALREVEALRGPPAGRTAKLATVGRADANSSPSALEGEAQVRRLEAAEPAANDLIAQIRARGVRGRRGLGMPSYMSGDPKLSAYRILKSNAGNLRFHLARPRIDGAGNVAAQAPSRGGDLALPLEIQMMLMQKLYSGEQEQP